MAYLTNFNNEAAREILIDIIRTVNQPENSKKLAEAKGNAGKEMILMMQHVFPLVMQIQTEVIKKHGFPGNREGLVQFAMMVREMEKDDQEISRLRSQIRAIYLPPIAINTTNDVLI
uniref:Protein C10 n=1 Tax=Megaselia scalaris TaxID=36166 RepID=T1H4T2_MEGSC